MLLGACKALPFQPSTTVSECTAAPGTSMPNVYNIKPEQWVLDIYNYAKLSDVNSPNEKFNGARYAAFRILGHQVNRWSDYVDMEVSPNDVVRITITYLSPQLIETILLNEVLLKHEISDTLDGFNEKILVGLSRSGSLDEILFLVTITATRYSKGPNGEPAITVDIPIENMTLTNSSNQTFGTKRDDHSIDQFIQLSHGPVSALIGYPMTVQNGSNCSLMLDPQVNNTISIHLEGLEINGLPHDPQTWTIRYKSLLGEGGPGVNPDYRDGAPIPDYWVPSQQAPNIISNIPNTVKEAWDPYWEKMACYIWDQVMFASSP